MKKYIPMVLFSSVFLVGIVLSARVGVTWDEPDNIFAGGLYVTFFREGFNPHAFDGFWDQRSYFRTAISTQNPTISHYPPVPNYVGSLFTILAQKVGFGLNGRQIIILFHWATVLFLGLLVVSVYRFGLFFGLSPSMSAFAAVSAYLYPTIFGHGLTNLKDTAQVALFTLSLYYLVRNNLRIGAAVWGLAMATKFNAVYVPIIWGIYAVRKVQGIKKIIGVVCLGLVTAIVVWPYLWFDPVARIVEVTRYFATVGQGYANYWNGHMYTVGIGHGLWWYPWQALFLASPPVLLVLGAIGAIRVIREKERKKKLLLFWFCIPLLRAVLPSAAFYDGIRHFMEVIPALMLLAGIGLASLKGKFQYIAAVFVLTYLVVIDIQYFPYSTGYYNMFAGNPNINFDRDIEGLAVYEGLSYIRGVTKNASVWIPVASHTGWNYADDNIRIVNTKDAAAYMIVINKRSHILKDPDLKTFPTVSGFVPAHVILRGDAIFGWVYKKLE